MDRSGSVWSWTVAVAALIISIVAFLAAGASAWFTRSQAEASRDLVAQGEVAQSLRDLERSEAQKARATRVEILAHAGKVIQVLNRSDSPILDIQVGVEPSGGIAPFVHIFHHTHLAAGETKLIGMDRGPEHLVVTWTDIDGAVWTRRNIGDDFVIERGDPSVP